MNSVRVRMVCGLAMGVILAAAGAAEGQGVRVMQGGASIEIAQPDGIRLSRTPRESKIERYARVLALDEAQLDVAKDLTVAYERSVAEARKALNTAMKEAQSDMNAGDHTAFQERMGKAMKEHGEASKTLTEQYLSDLKSLLHPDQEANWAKLERLRRRESVLSGMMMPGGGSIGGSNVDLIPMVGRLEVPEGAKPKVDETLLLYEVDLDRPLQERERNMEDDRQSMGGFQQFTPETFQKKQERDRAVDVKVREINDKYVRLIGAELPEELATKLADEYRAKSYRSAYRATTAERELAAAGKLNGLNEKQRQQLAAMQERYQREARAASDRLAAAMRRAEDEGKSTGNGPMMLMGSGQGEGVDPQVADARAHRRELDSKLREDMEQLLSPEQLADAREAAKPRGMQGHQIEVIADGMGENMVFVSDIELDGDFEVAEGGEAIMIFQTVETTEVPPPPPAQDPD